MSDDSPPAVLRRRRALEALGSRAFDLCIIGGGVTGAGIARDAALRGLSVALVEKGDIACGTSSQSSKLLHGGVRYLEQFAFGLVRESIRERDALARNAAHLARPLPFLFPIYDGDRYGPMFVNLGMWLYSAFAMFRQDRRHEMLSTEGIAEREPQLSREDMRGATLYYDCMTDDGRLTLETALDAAARGAVIATRARATTLIRDGERVVGVRVRDELSDNELELRARVTVSATGPWTDALLQGAALTTRSMLRPTKGVHIVVPKDRLPATNAIVMRSVDDKRVLFTIPWRERTVIGTTDTDDVDGPDACRASGADVDYLLRTANAYFPGSDLTREDVISTWAGLRPLLRADGVDPSAVSREHELRELAPGLLAIFGGKLTTYRLMAEQVVDRAGLSKARCATAHTPLPGSVSEAIQDDPEAAGRALAEREGLPGEVGEHLALSYGDRAQALLDFAREAGLPLERVDPELPVIWPELAFAAREEWAMTLEDALRRRTLIALKSRDQGLGIAAEAARLMAPELGWDEEEQARQVAAYERSIAAARAWRGEASAS